MSLECQQRIIPHHADAVIDNPDQLPPAAFYLNLDASGLGVKRVFQQLFHHRRGAVNDLARGNLVRDLVGEYVYATHIGGVLRG